MEQPDDAVTSAFLQVVATEGFERNGTALASVWLDINEALEPVLGTRGVAAMYGRSVHIVQREFPWLAGIQESLPPETQLAALARVFDAQDFDEAARAGASMLRFFCRLLASLVGPSLTERLLRPVIFNLSSARDERP